MPDYGYTPDPNTGGPPTRMVPQGNAGDPSMVGNPAIFPSQTTFYGTPTTTSDPTFGWSVPPTQNNLPIGPDWLRQNMQQSDPYGVGLRAPGYNPAIPLAEQNREQMLGVNAAEAQGLMGLTAAGMQNANDIANAQIGALNTSYGNQKGYLQTDYNLGLARNALAQQANQVDIAANARQPGFLNTLHDIAQRGFDVTRQRGADIQRLAQQGFDINRAQAALQAQGQNFNQFNQAVGQGNVLTGGYGVQRNLTAQDLMRQQQAINVNAATSAQQYLQNIQNTNLASEGESARYFENMAQTGDQAKQLQIRGQQLGLEPQQLQNELNKGLDRLGLSNFTSVSDLLDKMNSNNLAVATQAVDTWNKVLAASDAGQTMG